MSKTKLFLFHTGNKYKSRLSKVIKTQRIDCWLFLGKNALLRHEIGENYLKDINKINISKKLSESQHNNLNDYLDYIDNLEKNTGKELWWSSYLSWKNPWISMFYLRFTQMDVFKKIVFEDREGKKNVLAIIEEYVLFESISFLCKSKNQFDVYLSFPSISLLKFKKYIRSYLKRVLHIIKYIIQNYKNKKIFKYNLFNSRKRKEDNLVILPTFIDARSFRSGDYKDPFLGKLFEENIFNNKHVVIIPIVVSASEDQLILFNQWLTKKCFSVLFLFQTASIPEMIVSNFTNVFPPSLRSEYEDFLSYNVNYLINWEKLEDWSNFSMQDLFISKFSKKIAINKNKKIIIYPFENQKWERVLLYEMKKRNEIYCIGLQNAPCPKLSTRFYFSKRLVNQLPLPDIIISTGKISYDNLNEFYKNFTEIIKSHSARLFINDCQETEGNFTICRNVMVGCSIGKMESIELIIFVVDALREQKNYHVNIVPHPLAKYNYRELLKFLKNPDHINLSEIGYEKELKRSDFILFDSSTVGLEALSSGIQPIYIGHECSVHVNPNEYDSEVTSFVYNKNELINALKKEESIDYSKYKSISDKYFGCENTFTAIKIIKDQLNNK